MMRVLVDTHVLVWWASWSARVREDWIPVLTNSENQIFVSAVTAIEIETKRRRGKLDFDDNVADIVDRFGFGALPISMAHASLAGSLDWEHRDPFDRILVAQAMREDLVLLSADAAMKSAPGVRVL
ncbi:MAG TPA: type II toxin-antitoxin system VapC family toxin [Galbitalea sp.]|jgi:PIN domain nuclease of toxin-antitoxin system|nr:type II toxin-antitoxin system VapC family toxin [Galbitalea sp.]